MRGEWIGIDYERDGVRDTKLKMRRKKRVGIGVKFSTFSYSLLCLLAIFEHQNLNVLYKCKFFFEASVFCY